MMGALTVHCLGTPTVRTFAILCAWAVILLFTSFMREYQVIPSHCAAGIPPLFPLHIVNRHLRLHCCYCLQVIAVLSGCLLRLTNSSDIAKCGALLVLYTR